MNSFLLAISVLYLSLVVTPKKKIIDLDEAISQNLITAEVSSKGDYSGKCMSLKITSNNGKKLSIRVPSGTHFIPDDEGEQNIFVTTEQMLAISGKEMNRFTVEGFCSEHNDKAPKKGSAFAVTKTKDEKLLELVNYMVEKDFSDEVKQSTVWAVANGSSVSSIYEKGNDEVKALRSYVCDLTGQPNLWYNLEQEYGIAEDRNIEVNPVHINGLVAYRAEKPGHLDSKLFYENGDKIMDLGKGYDLKKTGKYSFEFEMRVKGWQKGNYYIQVSVDEEVIHKQEFEI